MNCAMVNVGSVGVVGRLRCRRSRRIRSEGLGGGWPSRVFVAARDVAVQLKESQRGGIVNGVPCADPKCCSLRRNNR